MLTPGLEASLNAIDTAQRQLLVDGYCVVDDAIDDGFLAELQRWSDEWIANTEHPDIWKYQGSDIKINGERHHSKRMSHLPSDPMVDRLIEHPRAILESLRIDDLLSGGVFQIICKPPGGPPLYWHQDWGRWDDPVSLSPWTQQVFLNWYLTPTIPENGCLRVIPGSHRCRIDLHSHLVQPHEGGGYAIEETNEWMFADHPEAIDVPVSPGQLVIGDARLLHATHPNPSTERRTVLLGWYYRHTDDAPEWWDGEVPAEIESRDPDLPYKWDRQPGRYLR